MGSAEVNKLRDEVVELTTVVNQLRFEQDGDPKKFESLEERVGKLSETIEDVSKKYDKAMMILQTTSITFKWGIKAIAWILSIFLVWKEHKNIWDIIKALIK